jgi:hypothetical protein
MQNVRDRKQPPGDRSKTVYTSYKHYIWCRRYITTFKCNVMSSVA